MFTADDGTAFKVDVQLCQRNRGIITVFRSNADRLNDTLHDFLVVEVADGGDTDALVDLASSGNHLHEARQPGLQELEWSGHRTSGGRSTERGVTYCQRSNLLTNYGRVDSDAQAAKSGNSRVTNLGHVERTDVARSDVRMNLGHCILLSPTTGVVGSG
ncbi:hypothetical protein D3C79_634560 [compost metagenome]